MARSGAEGGALPPGEATRRRHLASYRNPKGGLELTGPDPRLWLAGAALLPVAAALTYAGWRIASLEPQAQVARIARAGSGPCRLLILGDSGASRWPLRPPPAWQLHRVGLPGAASATIAGPARTALWQIRPHLVVLSAGGNDAAGIAFLWGERRRTAIARSAAQIAALARQAQQAGAQVVVLGLVPPINQPWWRALLIGPRQGEAMAAITAATQLLPGAAWLDVSALVAGERSDHLHFTPVAYARIDTALSYYRATASAASHCAQGAATATS
jgi:hypothetical protein